MNRNKQRSIKTSQWVCLEPPVTPCLLELTHISDFQKGPMLSMITTSGDNSHDEIYGTPTKKGKFQTKMCSNQPGAKHPTSGDRKRKHISAESTGAKLRAVEHKSASQMLSAEASEGREVRARAGSWTAGRREKTEQALLDGHTLVRGQAS